MHISDGILSIEMTVATSIVAAVFIIFAFKKMSNENISLVAAFSALFFITSFIHIPLGPSQIHLMLIGFIGIFLGSLTFLAVGIALVLQALLLGFGGISSLGANLLIMALPSFLVYLLFKLQIIKTLNQKIKYFFLGFIGVFISTLFLAIILLFAKDEYAIISYSLILFNTPTMLLEGIVTLFLLEYVKKSIPSLLKDTNL
uniref:cobalt transporter CbiM n=1 Tax=Aliarcobacter sp. TaxID=2321116 RepID=UPI004047D1E1